MADNKPDEKDDEQDVSAFLGVDPIYMNYSDERNKPFRAEADEDANDGEGNQGDLDTEDIAYSHQEWTREDGGQDPVTGEALDIDPAEQLRQRRELYKDPNWGPNVPHAMTGKEETSSTESQSSNTPTTQTTDTGSTQTVQSDGTTGDTKTSDSTPASGDDSSKTTTTAPSAPSAPKAASTKKTAASDNK